MYFKPEHISLIIAGTKTQTRRLVQPGDLTDDHLTLGGAAVARVRSNGRIKWGINRDYAVSPGRGKPGVWVNFDHPCYGVDIWADYGLVRITRDGSERVEPFNRIALAQGYTPLRIRITAIRQERLGDISRADVLAEGITYDGECYRSIADQPGDCISDYRTAYQRVWEHANGRKSWKPDLMVWVLSFEVVRS